MRVAELQSPDRASLYFIGVSTASSSIMRVFPQWAEHWQLGPCQMVGVDLPVSAPASEYRRVVAHIRDEPLVRGALVTTHKLDLFAAAADLFDDIESMAALMGETSCLSKYAPEGESGGDSGRREHLRASAKDPITAGLAMEMFMPPNHFSANGGDLVVLGAGGAAMAITWYWRQALRGSNRPGRIWVSDRSQARLEHMRALHERDGARLSLPPGGRGEASAGPRGDIEYVLVNSAADNDVLVHGARPGSLVINATGMGKDTPGSPLSTSVRFPDGALVWDLNYRGDLQFLAQARLQAHVGAIEDGWVYFLYGWTRVIAEVFAIDLPVRGPGFEHISRIAAASVGRRGAAGALASGSADGERWGV